MPNEDDLKIGHKYPFNACEILCSDNSFILEKIIENTKLANEDDDSDDSNYYRQKGKKLSEDDDSRKNSNDSNQENNLEDNDIVFFDSDKKNQMENRNKNNNLDNDNQDIDDNEKKKELIDVIVNDEENRTNDLSENIFKESTNKNELNKKIDDEGENKQNEIIKSLLENNKDDELNLVSTPEKSNEENSEINTDNIKIEENNINIKNDNENKENNKKVIFSEDTEDYNENTEEEYKSRGKKKGFHQKKKNLDNTNINMEKLISETNENKSDFQEDIINNKTNKHDNKENDLNDFIDLSDEKSKEHSISSLNNSLKSEYATYSFPNLDHLFDFLKQGNDLNYVLSGYFFKIFNHMVNCKKGSLLKYIYNQNIYILDNFIRNVQRRSICDCLCKLLTMHVDEANFPNSSKIKNEIIEKIFLTIREFDIEGLTNVSEMIVDCLNNKDFYFNFISDDKIFQIIKDLLINTNNTNYELNVLNEDADFPKVNKTEIYKNLLKILNKLNENILKDFGNSIVTPALNRENDVNVFNFQSINLDAGINGIIDEDLGIAKVEPIEIKTRLEKIYDILCEISYTIMDEYINSERVESENKTINTTYEDNKRILGTKRY